MKVLKNNLQEDIDYPKTIICDYCGSELEYEKSDIVEGALGAGYIECPVCKHKVMVDDDEYSTILTVDNIKFPTHFFHVSKETGAKDICDEETIREWIKNGIKYFRMCKDQDAWLWYQLSGNLMVWILRYLDDKEYDVIVSSNYYETTIPFQKEDYV